MDDRWDITKPILQLSDEDFWSLEDAAAGLQIVGGTGSGKTSGSLQTVCKTYMAQGYGALILTVKPEDATQYQQWAEITGRGDSVVTLTPNANMYFNFLQYEMNRPFGGETENLVELFSSIIEIANKTDLNSGDNAYFALGAKQLLRNAIDVCKLSEGTVSLPMVYEIINSAPVNTKQAIDDEWRKNSLCYRSLCKASDKLKHLPDVNWDMKMSRDYFMIEFPKLSERTRSIIISFFSTSADPFLRGFLRKLWCSEASDFKEEAFPLNPEITIDGAIVILDLPIKRYGHVGRISQSLYKLMFQQCMERRSLKEDGGRPVALIADENQAFINSRDVEFQQTARSSRILTVFATQSISNYHVSLAAGEHGKNQATSILGNLSTKFIHANSDPKSNEWASSLFGTHWVEEESQSMSKNARVKEFDGMNISKSVREIQKKVIEEREFTTFPNGGEKNNLMVHAVVHQAGRIWNLTNNNFLPTSFRQDFEYEELEV